MEPKKLLHLLENPFNLESEMIKDLIMLWEKHPYSQPLAYLRTRYLLEQNHPDFERASRRTLAIALNRRIYNEYISGKTNPLKPKPLSWNLNLCPDKPVETKGSGDANDRASTKESLPQNQGHDVGKTKMTQHHLIERFIADEPRISAPGKETSSGNLAERNIGQTNALVTETLAQIYVQQGFMADAIDIFEKLSAKNPEKSSYFAKIIENLKINLKP